MARTAKVLLTADVRGFKKATDDARKALDSIGQTKISPEAEANLKKIVSDDLMDKMNRLNGEIQSVTSEIKKMGEAGVDAHNAGKIIEQTKKLDELKKAYEEVSKAQKEISKGKFPKPEEPKAGGEEGGGVGSLFSRGGLIMAAASALGIRAAFNKRTEMARQRLETMALTTDQAMGGERSQFGFTPEERRRRLAEVSRAAGSVTGKEATRLAEVSELAQRAYGVEQGTTAEAIAVSRKAGVQDQAKFVASAIGSAVASGLTGSKIGEYLSSMTSYMASMSEGIDIDDGSLNGFAAALGQIPFFKNDPNRIFTALQNLNTTFKGGDPFQKAQATRAILGAAPGAGPAATEFRRSMGLFGKLDKETMANLQKAGMGGPALKALGAGGPQIIKNIFDEIMKSTEGMTTEDRLYEFQQRTGMEAGPAASIFGRLATGKGVNYEDLQKAMQTPEDLLRGSNERLNKTMGTLEGTFADLNATLSAIGENIASNIAEPFAKLGSKIDELIKAMGGDTAEVGGAVGTAAAVAGGAGALLGGKKLMAGAKGAAARVTKATQKGGLKGGAKALGRMGGKMAGRILPVAGMVFAAKDAWDLYDKAQRGEELTAKDWTALATSFGAGIASMIPGYGTAVAAGLTAANIGVEMSPDEMWTSGGAPEGAPAGAPAGQPAPTGTPAGGQQNMTPAPQKGKSKYNLTPSTKTQTQSAGGAFTYMPIPESAFTNQTPVTSTPATSTPFTGGFALDSNVIQGPWPTTPATNQNAPMPTRQPAEVAPTPAASATTTTFTGKDAALAENTQALRTLTGVIMNSSSKGQTQFGGRYPNGAPQLPSGAATGKR